MSLSGSVPFSAIAIWVKNVDPTPDNLAIGVQQNVFTAETLSGKVRF